jgi:molybdopterin/thiamine biosynthesis adenylyltransferase
VRITGAITAGQRQALDDLTRIASVNRGVQILNLGRQDSDLVVEISVDCSTIRRSGDGVRLRARERLILRVSPEFPFTIPSVRTGHTRWAGTPHVQWGRVLCLYVSPSTEWDPSDGIAGFIERLVLWLERAAAGELDGPGQPLHPPVAYSSAEAGHVVVRANAPRVQGDTPWLGVGLMRRANDDRVDVMGWRAVGDTWPRTLADARAAVGVGINDNVTVILALAVFLPRAIAFEYPGTASELVEALKQYGIDAEVTLGMLGVVAGINRELAGFIGGPADDTVAPPLYFFVGTPTRGIAGEAERVTHLAAWRFPDLGERIARLVPNKHSDVAEIAQLGREVLEIGQKWLLATRTSWARVYEARPEAITARDAATPASWLMGKQVLVLGTGALGAPIAEACVRSGASRVVVADESIVHPGILVRQPYNDEDVGQAKALMLAERLRRIRPDVTVEPWYGDVVTTMFYDGSKPPDFDLVIDATANRTVRTVIERRRTAQRDAWPALATVLIGHDAKRGIATLSRPGSSGAGADVLRRLGLFARASAAGDLADVVDDFFPDPPRSDFFQPEPGCSETTFIGSAADVVGLAGQLLTGVLHALAAAGEGDDMLALVVRSPLAPNDAVAGTARWLQWPNDLVLQCAGGDYEVRLSSAAVAEMRAEARRGARLRGGEIETGGTLLGAFDTAACVAWVDEATGPPPDSRLSKVHFEHGVEGVERRIAARRSMTARVTSFVGMWHSHPFSEVLPSPTDEAGMRELVWPVADAPPRALLLIVGGLNRVWLPWLAEGKLPVWYARVVVRDTTAVAVRESRSEPRTDIGMQWWSGGSRSAETPGKRGQQSRIRSWLRRWKKSAAA